MPRPRKVVQVPPAEALFILEAMMREGRIDNSAVEEYRARYREEVSSLEARIAQLRELSGSIVSTVVAALPTVAHAARRRGRKVARSVKQTTTKVSAKVSPERMKIRALQGRYLGLMHKIPATVMKKRFGKDTIEKKGKEAVDAEMEKYVSTRGRTSKSWKRKV